jgi:hypothetical protein
MYLESHIEIICVQNDCFITNRLSAAAAVGAVAVAVGVVLQLLTGTLLHR